MYSGSRADLFMLGRQAREGHAGTAAKSSYCFDLAPIIKLGLYPSFSSRHQQSAARALSELPSGDAAARVLTLPRKERDW